MVGTFTRIKGKHQFGAGHIWVLVQFIQYEMGSLHLLKKGTATRSHGEPQKPYERLPKSWHVKPHKQRSKQIHLKHSCLSPAHCSCPIALCLNDLLWGRLLQMFFGFLQACFFPTRRSILSYSHPLRRSVSLLRERLDTWNWGTPHPPRIVGGWFPTFLMFPRCS